MLTADGRCKTLDAAADGYVRAEACTVIYMTADACPDLGTSEPVSAGAYGSAPLDASAAIVLRGTFVNQVGCPSTSSLIAHMSMFGAVRPTRNTAMRRQ